MRLPAQAIDSFQRNCLEDINRIWSFMENKTSKELRSSHSICVLGGLRNTLQLQFSQISSAWRHLNPENGNANTAALAWLGEIVESTKVAVAHNLRFSGKAIAYQIPWRPDEPFDPMYDACPNPYTSLAQFHRKLMPFAHRDSPHSRQPSQPGGAAGRAGHMSWGWLGVVRWQLCLRDTSCSTQIAIGKQQWVTGFHCVCAVL